MRLDFTGFLYAMSYALDAAEKEVTGATAEHGKRVAWLSWLCASGCGYTDLQMLDLVACAILHDNAIAEYIREELDQQAAQDQDYETFRSQYGEKAVHARIGEERIHLLPFHGDITNVILWHHENADGTGPFGKREDETNLFSQIIHLADMLDMFYRIPAMTEEEYRAMAEMTSGQAGRAFSREAVRLFQEHVTWDRIRELQDRGPQSLLNEHVPVLEFDYSDAEMTHIAEFFAGIVDYKSSFTRDHSIGVAKKAQIMAQHYGFPHDKMVRFAFAGAMHDIGKMVVGNNILEKPDKLDNTEFSAMKNHAAETYRILSGIRGLEDVTEWAANHHEKLDGTGYSRRLSADQQTFEDRLMACIDIYQALTEKRPYKDGLSHRRSIQIMRGMAADGKIDAKITEDMAAVFDNGQETDPEDTEDVRLTTKVWKCSVCGYTYEGDTPPASCPICDSDTEAFELQ